ncbi:23S rRNA (uracil(1939)-C(5))-methyltransferase RlmD [Aestuariirhabdus litorea]|uniref:23S rRNA (uracil(1939)-C(5))-methyltransferase RlmD n=1 Tax=Aestuariirhabdus litorea TaxID=2528527 RepID=UPI0013E300A2|nr:23S rRNA (uracil(1939)-C(5))-methyltransferase RlmD [Aestuariirhabdus litorea]
MKFYQQPGRSRQQPQKPVRVHVEGMTHDLRGIARHEGKPLFIDNALPGEQVSVRIERRHGRYLEGRALHIEEASRERVSPRCQHFGRCGGCSLQYLDSQAQLTHKEQAVLGQLERFAAVQPDQLAPPLGSQPFGYRSRARLAVYYHRKQKQLLVGFREARSRQVISLAQCPVLAPELECLLQPLQQLIGSLKAFDQVSHLELLLGERGPAVLFRHLQPLCEEDQQRLQAFAEQHLQQLYLQGDSHSVHCFWSREGNPRLSYPLSAFSLSLAYQPLDFTQVNRPLNEAMVTRAMEWLDPGPGERVLDLFCGLGNFSLPAARLGAEVVGVEGSATMVQRAQLNAQSAGIETARFHVLDLTEEGVLRSLCPNGVDKVVLDPPRAGAAETISDICQLGPASILYISCDPATLARDAGLLRDRAYRLQRLCVMDMFPQTGHIESMALFVQSGN